MIEYNIVFFLHRYSHENEVTYWHVKETLEITVVDNLMINEIFASYDFIQLIGENGGVIGVIFGWSVLFIMEVIQGWMVKNDSWKFMIKRGATFKL